MTVSGGRTYRIYFIFSQDYDLIDETQGDISKYLLRLDSLGCIFREGYFNLVVV